MYSVLSSRSFIVLHSTFMYNYYEELTFVKYVISLHRFFSFAYGCQSVPELLVEKDCPFSADLEFV